MSPIRADDDQHTEPGRKLTERERALLDSIDIIDLLEIVQEHRQRREMRAKLKSAGYISIIGIVIVAAINTLWELVKFKFGVSK